MCFGTAGKMKRRFSCSIAVNFDFAPVDTLDPTCAESFHNGLFCRPTCGESFAPFPAGTAISGFPLRKNPLEKETAVLFEHLLDSVYFGNISADPDYRHRKSEFPDSEGNILTAESEVITDSDIDLYFTCFVRNIVKIAVRIGNFVVYRRRNNLITECQKAID